MHFVSEIIDEETGLSRQVFRDQKIELFVWWQRNVTPPRRDVIRGFELHHAINTPDEWSIRWTDEEGVSFHRLESHGAVSYDGDGAVMVQTSCETLPLHDLHAEFVVRSRQIDEAIRSFVLKRLSQVIRGLRS